MTGNKATSIRVLALVAASGVALTACGSEQTVTIQGAMACGAILTGNGESRQCYAADSVAAGESCAETTQTRVCHNGAWDPDFDVCAHLSCFVQNGGDCGATANGSTESRPCYVADSVPAGQTCTETTQYRTCVAGAWAPDYPTCDHLSCFVQGSASCGSTPSGNSETRSCYGADSVPYGQTCQATAQTRTCDNGNWSPDYPTCAHLTCTVSQSGTFLRVNIGGSAYTGAQVWSADAPTGLTFSTSNTTTPGGPYAQNTIDEQALLTSARWWDISGGQNASATVSGLKNGAYTVRFLVCECVWSTVGARVFGFEAEGLRLDSSIDPYALAASQNDVGVWQEYTGIVVADGELNLAWPAVVDNPELRAMEIAGPGFVSAPAGVLNTHVPTLIGTTNSQVEQGVTYNILPGTWTSSGVAVTPTYRTWDFYIDEVYFASYDGGTAYISPGNFLVGDVLKNVERATIDGVEYTSSLADAIEYTTVAPASTFVAVLDVPSLSLTTGVAVSPVTPVRFIGGSPPYTITASPAIPGLTVDASTGQITGTPSTVGGATYRVSGVDAASATAFQDVWISIQSVQTITPVASISADVPFANQLGGLQFGSQYPAISTISDILGGGFTGGMTTEVNGSVQRWGKMLDPNGGGFPTIRHALQVGDPFFGGSSVHRMDIIMGGTPGAYNGDTLWFAVRGFLPGAVFSQPNTTVLLFDVHGSPDGNGFYVQLQGNGANAFLFQIIRSSMNNYTNFGLGSHFSPDVWVDMIVRQHYDESGATSRTQFWKDDQLLVDSNEINGLAGQWPVYPKMACYDGAGTTVSPGYWWHYRKAIVVMDPSQEYTQSQIRALLN